jgi:polyferredoxin
MGTGGCCRLCPVATGHSLVALFFLSMSIKDRPLHGPWSSHRFIILSTYLLMGAGMFVTLLSWASALSEPTDWRRG